MSHSLKILLAMGTRPEIIKMAPIYHQLKKLGVDTVLLHTGQHDSLAKQQYEFFQMEPDHVLTLERNNGHAAMEKKHPAHELSKLGSNLLKEISQILTIVEPSLIMVHGDTISGMMAALAGFYHQCPVAHIEAGLRSYDPYNPFPEEMNRMLIGQIAQWHFAPTERAKKNLLQEGIDSHAVHMVGNTIVEATQLGIDSLCHSQQYATGTEYELIKDLITNHKEQKILMVTMHRRENQDNNILQIVRTLREILLKYKDMDVLWPMHPNPKIQTIIRDEMVTLDEETQSRFHIIQPLVYPLFLWAMQHSWLVLTDSGGVQEESAALKVPVFILRDTTERPEVIEAGIGILAGTERGSILNHVDSIYHNEARYTQYTEIVNPFGDGNAAEHICNIILADTHTDDELKKKETS